MYNSTKHESFCLLFSPMWRNVVWNRKVEALAEAFVYETTFRLQGGYAITTRTSTLIQTTK